MRITTVLRAASHHRTPLIKFLGKRTPPKAPDHSPHAHPASPTHSLPDSFVSYRSKAQQHGPLAGHRAGRSSGSGIGGTPGRELGSVEPEKGEFFDREELPMRFRRTPFTEVEMEAIDTGGASLFG